MAAVKIPWAKQLMQLSGHPVRRASRPDQGAGRSWPARGYFLLAGLVASLAWSGCKPGTAGGTRSEELPSQIFSRVEVIGTRGTGLGQLNKPRSVAVDREDNVYVVDMTARMQKFSPAGKFLLAWQMPETSRGKPKGMGCDADGNIIVIEPHYSRINHFSTEGELVAQWGVHGTNSGEFTMPRAVAVNSHGELVIAQYTQVDDLQVFSGHDKRWLFSIGRLGEGQGEFNRPEGLAVDAADRIFVADSCNHRVQIFSPDGHWLESFGKPGTGPGEFSYPNDIVVDRDGLRYVSEFGNSRVQIFDAHNHLLEVLGGSGDAPSQMNDPWAIALDSHGNLYVADGGNHRILKFVRRHPWEETARKDPRRAPRMSGSKRPAAGSAVTPSRTS